MTDTPADAPAKVEISPQLVQAAANQMRRPPPGYVPAAKKLKAGEAEAPVIGRFAYDAPQRLTTGCKGLLMTCNMRNERTAAKEALELIQHYLPLAAARAATATAAPPQAGDGTAVPAAGTTAPEATGSTSQAPAAEPTNTDTSGQAAATSGAGAGAAGAPGLSWAIAKVGAQGMVVVLLQGQSVTAAEPAAPAAPAAAAPVATASGQPSSDEPAAAAAAAAVTAAAGDVPSSSQQAAAAAPVAPEAAAVEAGATFAATPFLLTLACSMLVQDVEQGIRARTRTCLRICPFETTCLFEMDALKAQIPGLAAAFKESALGRTFAGMHAAGSTIKFAGAFKNRNGSQHVVTWNGDMTGSDSHPYQRGAPAGGQQDAGAEGSKDKKKEAPANEAAGLRQAVLQVLATSMAQAMEPWQLTVSLTAPDLVLLCEVIPAGGQLYAGLALVPATMCRTKPNIILKTLSADK